jgi:hypothetical protein
MRSNPSPELATSLPGGVAPLWTVSNAARFLARSERWVWDALSQDPEKPGSIPFIRIPGGRGSRGHGSPRFVPTEIIQWVAAGCPPAATFRSWSLSDQKGKKHG